MKKVRLQGNESGFAAIVVAITLVIVLSLLTVGFADLMRNEQNQVTNRQLSNQAFYAAESGINDAQEAINAGFTGSKDTCPPYTSVPPGFAGNSWQYLADNDVKTSGTSTQWSCLLINTAPTSLEYGAVDTVEPTVFVVHGVQGAASRNVSSFEIYWQDADASQTAFRNVSGVSNTAFPPGASWNATGVLRVSITALPPGNGPVSRSSLQASTYTAFLYPSTSASMTATFSPGQTGQILNGGCSTGMGRPRYCKATVTISGSGFNTDSFLFALRSVYSKTSVHIEADNGLTSLEGAQTVIDSTGRSEDVLKRLQVRVPASGYYAYPGFTMDSIDGICKQLTVYPGYASGCGISGGGSGVGAGLVSGCPGGCPSSGGSSPPLTVNWWGNFTNVSPAPPPGLSYTGCLWDWGDGSSTSNVACQPGEQLAHQFAPASPTSPPITTEYHYQVQLTVYRSDGLTGVSAPWSVCVPWGPDTLCPTITS